MCTNTSRPPSSGLIKPYPRSPLKNLTVPLMAIGKLLPPQLLCRRPRDSSAGHSRSENVSAPKGLSHSADPQLGGGTSKPAPKRRRNCGRLERGRKGSGSGFAGKPLECHRRGGVSREQFCQRREQDLEFAVQRPRRVD